MEERLFKDVEDEYRKDESRYENVGGYGVRKKKNYKWRIICLIIGVIWIFVDIMGYRVIAQVKKGTFNGYPNITVEEGFNAFFTECDWDAPYKTNGGRVVKFSGHCFFDNVPAQVEIVFEVEGESFQIISMRIGDNEMSQSQIAYVIDTIMRR